MKKQLLFLSFFLFIGSMAIGQIQFGAGGTLINDFGIQGRAKIPVGDKINALPALSYFLSDGTVFALDAVASYDVAEVAEFPIYATGGLTFLRSSFAGFSNTANLISLGGGTVINGNIYAELRLLIGVGESSGNDLGINVGYYF